MRDRSRVRSTRDPCVRARESLSHLPSVAAGSGRAARPLRETRPQSLADTGPDGGRVPFRFAQRTRSSAGERKMTPRAATTNGDRIAATRSEQTFFFQTLQRRVNRPDRIIAAGPRSQIAANCEAVRIVL